MITRMMESGIFQESMNSSDTLALVLLVIVFVLIMAWLLYKGMMRTPAVPAAAPLEKVEPQVIEAVTERAVPFEDFPAPDDLAVIEGIGPKIAATLNIAGIVTFTQLASTDIDFLEKILRDAGLRLADPRTWPEQAHLAAIGDQSGLKELQDQLKGGS